MAEYETQGMTIKVEATEGYELPATVRAALEALADAVRSEAEAHESEVEGFRMGFMDAPLGDVLRKPGTTVPSGGGKIGGPITNELLCLGGFDCNGYTSNDTSCSWVYWD